MKSVKNLLFVVLVAIVVLSAWVCNSPSTEVKPNPMVWLEGTWIGLDGSGFGERWTVQDKHTLKGFGFTFDGADTLIFEELLIAFADTGIYYSAKVIDQNKGRTIQFRMEKQTDTSFIFANPGHDFPRFIIYERSGDNEMTVILAESEEADARRMVISMIKVK